MGQNGETTRTGDKNPTLLYVYLNKIKSSNHKRHVTFRACLSRNELWDNCQRSVSLKKFSGVVTVDLDHKVSETAGTVHHALTGDGVHVGDVLVSEGGVVVVVGVDVSCGQFVTFLSPLHEVTVIKLAGVSGVLSADALGLGFVPKPVRVGKGLHRKLEILSLKRNVQFLNLTSLIVCDVICAKMNWSVTYEDGVSAVVVGLGVPNGVQVTSTADTGEIFRVTTSIALWVVGVKTGGGVEGLVDVTSIVDDHTESE